MLYFVKPRGELLWVAGIDRETLDIARKHGKDVGLVDWWERSERQPDVMDVRIALRYGVAVTGGIVVDAGHIVEARRPLELARVAREAAKAREAARPAIELSDSILEQMYPGWTAQTKETMAASDAAIVESIEEAVRETEALLAAEVKSDLVTHWARLGGAVPTPA